MLNPAHYPITIPKRDALEYLLLAFIISENNVLDGTFDRDFVNDSTTNVPLRRKGRWSEYPTNVPIPMGIVVHDVSRGIIPRSRSTTTIPITHSCSYYLLHRDQSPSRSLA